VIAQPCRRARVTRRTSETQIALELALDPTQPRSRVETGNGWLDHLVGAMVRWAGWELALDACSDCAVVGPHHLAEDTGLAIAEGLRSLLWQQRGEFGVAGTSQVIPLGDAAPGVVRAAHSVAPMDEALALAAVDLSGRAGCYAKGLDDPMWLAFCGGLAAAGITLHLSALASGDAHHLHEAAAKALGRAMGEACRWSAGATGPPAAPLAGTPESASPVLPLSTKGRVHLEVELCRS
jgi:imidazoleglycerol-phosphate dehydratase